MRATDELNNITTEYEEYDIDTYFDVMDISDAVISMFDYKQG